MSEYAASLFQRSVAVTCFSTKSVDEIFSWHILVHASTVACYHWSTYYCC